MTGWTTIAVLAAVTGCAGVQRMPQRDSASGHWIGEIDRDGWLQPLSLEIDRGESGYRGEWRPAVGLGSRPLELVEVHEEDVRCDTDKLRCVGHVNGSTLSGKVTNKLEDAAFGEFSVTQDGSPIHA